MIKLYQPSIGLLRGKEGGASFGRILLFVAVMMGGLLATAQQQISLSTDTISAQLSPGASTTKVLTITNTGDAALTISSFELQDQYAPGTSVSFSKANYANWLIPANQDRITDKVWLTRDLTKSLFNAKSEVSSTSNSPSGTAWARGTVNELSAEDFTSFSAMHNNDPQSLIGDTTTLKIGEVYYTVYWTGFTGGNGGGGFSYRREPMFAFYGMNTTISTPMAAGATQDLTFSLSDEGFTAGMYYGQMTLNTDDPSNPTVTVVVELEVLEGPEFEISEESLLAEVSNEQDTVIKTFTITNTGSSALVWSGTTNGNTEDMCATFSALGGTIEVGESADYTVTFTNSCNEGTYEWPFVITSGDKEVTLNLTAIVDGEEAIEVDTLIFEATYVGVTRNSTLVVRSTGNALLSVSSITSNNPAYTITKQSFTVEPGDSEDVTVRFKPTETGTASAQLLIISNNAAEDSVYVAVGAEGLGAPVMQITPTTKAFALESGEITTDSIAVFNNGDSDLIWKYTTSGVASTEGGITFEKADYADISLPENQDQLTDSVYLARDENGPIYDYNGNDILFALGSAKELTALDYTDNFRTAVGSNADELPGKILSIYIPEEDRYFDLHIESWTCCSNGGGLKYTRYEVFRWIKPTNIAGEGEEVSFAKANYADWLLEENQDRISDKVWLTRQNNGAPFNIVEQTSWSSNTTTIKWALGKTVDLGPAAYSSDWRTIRNQLNNLYSLPGKVVSLYLVEEDRYFDLTFSSWTSSNSGGGFAYTRQEVLLKETTEMDQTEYARVEVNANLPEGSYTGELAIESNDPLLPKATIPVSFTVTGGLPNIASTLDSVNFGTSRIGIAEDFVVKIKNSGLGTLEVTNVISSNTAFGVAPTAFEVKPYSTFELLVTVNSGQVGELTGQLTLTSNDPSMSAYEIELAGETLDLPSMSIPDLVFYDTLDYDSTNIQYLTVQNTGAGILEWEIAYDTQFEKLDYARPTTEAAQDRITDNFWLTRADEQGFFNALEADGYEEQPTTFEWGNDTSTFLSTDYSYFRDNWRGSHLSDKGSISLHLLEDDLYFDMKFSKWTEDGNGGGFAYQRRKAVRWLGLGHLAGTMEADSIAEIPIHFDAGSTPQGDYVFNYKLISNDPENPEQTIIFHLHVDGKPAIEVSTDSVGLGEYAIGTTHEGSPTFTISNSGGADLEVSLASDNAAFSFESSSFVIPSAGSVEVATLFTPEDTLVYSGLITIISNDAANDTIQVKVTAEGFVGAEIGLSALNFSATLVAGGAIEKTIVVSNTGVELLEWYAGVGKLDKENYADFDLAKNQDRIYENTWLTREDSRQLFNISENDPSVIKWALGYSKDKIPSNYSTDWRSVRNALPGGRFTALPGNVVSLYVENEDTYYDLYFTKWTSGNQGGGVTYYRSKSGLFSTFNGEIAADADDQELIITLDATGLDAGVHNYEYYIFHNGVNKVDTISVALTVLGASALAVTDSIDFGASPIGDETVQEIEVTNTGSVSGVFTLASNNAVFSVSSDEYKVKPNESITVEVSFNPTAVSTTEGIITLTTNDPASSTFEVAVSGSGSAPATIAVEYPSLETSLFFGQVLTKSISISNSGDFDLEWSLGVSGEEVHFEKLDYADHTLAENQDRISDDLWITRAVERGIYNVVLESRYDDNEDDSPLGTLWLPNPTSEAESLDDYTYWEDARDQEDLPGETYSMQDIESGSFYDITWENWTENGEGGGFSYTRKPVLGVYKAVEFSSKTGSIAPGQSVNVEITFNPAGDFDGNFELPLTIKSNDPANGQVEVPLSLSVKGIIVDQFIGDELTNEGFISKTIDLTGVFEDAQGDQLTYTAASSDETVVTTAIVDNSLVVTEVGFGTAILTVTAKDATGNSAFDRFDFVVNAIPDASGVPDQNFDRLFSTVTLDIASYFEDLDGDALSFSLTNSSDGVVTAVLSGSVITFSEQAIGTSEVTITAEDANGGSVEDVFNVNINLLAQAITFDSTYVKTYGDGNFELEATTTSELQISFASSDESILTISGTTATILGAGNVTITASQSGGDPYAAAQDVTNELTIAKAALTAKAENVSIVYGSTPAYSVTYSGFVGADDSSTLETPASGVSVTPALGGVGTYMLQVNEDAVDANYDIVYVDGTLEVTPASLVVTAENQARVYGEENPNLAVTYEGFVNDETEDVLTTAVTVTTSASATSSVGQYPIQVSGGAAANYTLSYGEGQLAISAKALTVTADAQSKVYGESDPALTYVLTGTLETGDELTGELSREAGENAGTYAITQNTLTAGGNYAITFEASELTIAAKALTVTADAQSKVYGESDPALTYVLTGTLETGDELTGELIREAGENAGTYTITQNTLTAGDNYAITFEASELTIVAKTLTVTAEAQSKVYGESDPALTYALTGTLVAGDELTGELSREAGENAGTYAILQNTLTAGDNYAIRFESGELTIAKKQLVVTATDASRVFGQQNPPLVFTYDGFANAENVAVLTEEPMATTEATTTSNVGTYAILLSGGVATNYEFTLVGGELLITKATATVSFANLEQQADGTAKSPTVTTSPQGLNFTMTFGGASRVPSEVGTYAVRVTLEEVNYQGSGEAVFIITSPLGIDQSEVSVYPNPTSQYVKVVSARSQGVHVFDLQGKVLQTGMTNEQIDISGLQSGVYLIRVDGQMIRIIKE